MTQCIVFKTVEGGVGIIHPSPEWFAPDSDGVARTIEALVSKDVPDGATWRIADTSVLPQSHNWRNAWTDDLPTQTVDVDFERAKSAHVALIINKAIERVPPDSFGRVDFTVVESEIAGLRIAEATSLQELYNLWPASIQRRNSAREYEMHSATA